MHALPSLLLLLLSLPAHGTAASPGVCGSRGMWVERAPGVRILTLEATNNCTLAERHLDRVWLPTAKHCRLLDWDVSSQDLHAALEPLRNARLLLVGDSLVLQLEFAFRSLLEAEFVIPFPHHEVVRMAGEQAANGQRQALRNRVFASLYNLTIDYLRNNVLGEHFNDVLPQLAARYDYILVSAGLWYNEKDTPVPKRNSSVAWRPRQRAEFERDLKGFGSAVRALSLQSRIFWLQPSPQHLLGGGSFLGNLSTSCEKRKPEDVVRARWRSLVAREHLASSGMTLLETVDALDPLFDSHPFIPAGRKDCTHFCLVGAAQIFQTSLILSHILWLVPDAVGL